MTNFYELDEEGNIKESGNIRCSHWKNCNQTEEDIVYDCDGRLVLESKLNREKELKFNKYIKSVRLKKANEEYILSVYPEYKQRNLGIYGTDEEKRAFKDFKDKAVEKYDKLIEKVNECKNDDELNDIQYIND
jgi:hypothetical protein